MMRKERNSDRKVTQPNEMNKRRKINENEYEETKTAWGRANQPEMGTKRKEEEEGVFQPARKKVKEQRQFEDEIDTEEMIEMANKYKKDERFHDQDKIETMRKKLFDIEKRAMEERKEKAEAFEKSWELARVCREILKDIKGEWQERAQREHSRRLEGEIIEERKDRFREIGKKKKKIEEDKNQRKIDTRIKELSQKSAGS